MTFVTCFRPLCAILASRFRDAWPEMPGFGGCAGFGTFGHDGRDDCRDSQDAARRPHKGGGWESERRRDSDSGRQDSRLALGTGGSAIRVAWLTMAACGRLPGGGTRNVVSELVKTPRSEFRGV